MQDEQRQQFWGINLSNEYVTKTALVLKNTMVSLKVADLVVDSIHAFMLPTSSHIIQVAWDVADICAFGGVPQVAIGLSVITAAVTLQQEGLGPALEQLSTVATYMMFSAFPPVTPVAVLIGKAAITLGTVNNAYNNAYALTTSYYGSDRNEFILQSYKIWCKHATWLAEKTGLEVFKTAVERYNEQIHQLEIDIERDRESLETSSTIETDVDTASLGGEMSSDTEHVEL